MSLRLDDQLCFLLYAASRAIQQRYRPLLEPLDLTYPQYLVMLVLWEQDGLSVKGLGHRLQLDSGTLTPMLKRMEVLGHVRRERSTADGRVVHVSLTEAGQALKARAEAVPGHLLACFAPTSPDQIAHLKTVLDSLLSTLQETA